MAIDVTIKSNKLFKKELKINDVIFDDMRYGIMDEAYRLVENETGEYTVVFNNNHICRGYEVSFKKGIVNLRMSVPTSRTETEFFYDYIKKIAKKMNTNYFIREGKKMSFSDISMCIKEDISLSEATLCTIEDDIDNEKYESMYLFGAMNPIAISKQDLVTINKDTRKLGEFMHNLQSQDIYYSKASVYKRSDDTAFGIFVLTEDVPSVVPYKAKLFMAPKDLTVKDWYMGFVFDNEFQGTCRYEDFLDNTKKGKNYDIEHFMITLSKTKMKNLLEKYKVEP